MTSARSIDNATFLDRSSKRARLFLFRACSRAAILDQFLDRNAVTHCYSSNPCAAVLVRACKRKREIRGKSSREINFASNFVNERPSVLSRVEPSQREADNLANSSVASRVGEFDSSEPVKLISRSRGEGCNGSPPPFARRQQKGRRDATEYAKRVPRNGTLSRWLGQGADHRIDDQPASDILARSLARTPRKQIRRKEGADYLRNRSQWRWCRRLFLNVVV